MQTVHVAVKHMGTSLPSIEQIIDVDLGSQCKSCRTFTNTPQVRLKMNDKKPSKFQFYFSGVLEAFSMLKK